MSFEYKMGAVSADLDSEPDISQPSQEKFSSKSADVDAVLGLDLDLDGKPDDPQARKKRARNFSQEHLLSARGLKYIRTNAPQKLRPKLNHRDEYKNLTNLLTYYQIWGHNLYPKANFSDFINLCQITGKKKEVRLMRQVWVSEDMAMEEIAKLGTDEIQLDNIAQGEQGLELEEDRERRSQTEVENATTTSKHRNSNGLFINEEDDSDFDDLYAALASVPGHSTAVSAKTAIGSSLTEVPKNPTVIESTGSPSISNRPAVTISGNSADYTMSDLTPERDTLSDNLQQGKPSVATTVQQESIDNHEDIPDFDDFENFDDEYAAEMEAMRGID